MSSPEPMDAAKTGLQVVSEVIRLAGESPQAREAGSNLGKTAVTLTKAINNVLLPIAAMNYAVDKARIYFNEKFPQEMAAKAGSIPPGNIVEPKASVAGPALQGLAFTHEEPILKEMFLGLLKSAMDSDTADQAHPAFVDFIKQITSEEAMYLAPLLMQQHACAIVEIRLQKGSGWSVLCPYVANIILKEDDQPVLNPRFPAMVDNWIRLGLVQVDFSKRLIPDISVSPINDPYDWVRTRPEWQYFSSKHAGMTNWSPGTIRRTELGAQFAKAVGIVE